MSKKLEKEKVKAAVLEKAAQNLPTAPAPGQLPAPDAQGVWNPPPLRPMAKVAEPVRVGPKVDWNGVPREPGDVPTRIVTRLEVVPVGTLSAYPPMPEVADAVTPAPMEMPSEVFKSSSGALTKTETNAETPTPGEISPEAGKHSPPTKTKVETKRVPNPGSEKQGTAMAPEDKLSPGVPEAVFKTTETRGKKGSMLYASSFKKPPRKPRSRGIYEVFMRGRVQGSGVPSKIGVLEVLIPEVASYNTREAAELEAETLAKGNPGKTVEVHRRLSRMTFEATTTTKLVKN